MNWTGLFWGWDILAFVILIHASNWWSLIGANWKKVHFLYLSDPCSEICFSYHQIFAQDLWFGWSFCHYSWRSGHYHKVKGKLQSRSLRGWFKTWSLLTWHLVRAFVWLESTGEGCNLQNLRPECSGDIWWTVPFIVKEYANCYVGLFFMSAFLPWSY